MKECRQRFKEHIEAKEKFHKQIHRILQESHIIETDPKASREEIMEFFNDQKHYDSIQEALPVIRDNQKMIDSFIS